ncbi:hypothetical protein GCM10010206_29130 [Streptomyces cinerochromogenes]|nr:hypothetical protein GCM10010206_29130 [Streptomyces cinerochromogenes]
MPTLRTVLSIPVSVALPPARAASRRSHRRTADTDAVADPRLTPALPAAGFCPRTWRTTGVRAEIPKSATRSSERRPGAYSGTMSGAPSLAASAVWSSGWSWDSRSASTRFS